MLPSRRRLKGLTAQQIIQVPKEELKAPPTLQDLQSAKITSPRTVTDADHERYKAWMDEFGSG